MKKHIIFGLCLVLMAGGFSACKKVASESVNNSKTIVYEDGTQVTKTYQVVPGEGKKEEIQEEEAKSLCKFQAKRLLKKQLQKEEAEVYTVPVRIGYYECNNYQDRLNLYKLEANKLITLQCDEIVTENGSTYWVTVELTWRGWWLKESPRKKLFPEDLIDPDEAYAFLNPYLDQDQWGIPSVDSVVSPQIVEAMKTFYRGLWAGRDYDQSLMDAKMVCAMSLLNTLASYGVQKLPTNPFTRDAELTEEMVNGLTVLRMPRLQNAYLVTVGENSFLYVIEEAADQQVTIVDLAYLAPKDLRSLNQTVCSLAGTLTKYDILSAREAKRLMDEYEAKMKELLAKQPKKAPVYEEEEDDFEMCETSGSLKKVEHSDPTLYELAKEAEHYEDVLLRAAVMKVSRIDELKVTGNKKNANATAEATYKLTRVNAVGRIYLGLVDGTKETKNVSFEYNKRDGWKVADEAAQEEYGYDW